MIYGTNLKIYNAKNDLVDLDDLDSIFSVSPEGFGASIENNIFNAGASFKSSGVDMKSSSLKLNLYFGLGDDNSEMVEYRKFVEFLNYPPYRLVYITEGTELFRDCILNEITKSDINTNQVLLEQVTFDFLTPFYKEISETYKPNSDTEGDGKIYTGTNKPRNLIANPNFLNNMQDWSNVSDPEGTYQVQTPATDKPTSNILKLTSSNNKLSSFLNAWGLKVRKGERLSFRVDIKTENNPDYDRPVIRVVYGTGEKNYKYSDLGITASSSSFKTAAISFIVPEDGVFMLYLINQNWSTIGEMSTYFREPMLIRGDISDMPVEQYDKSYPNLNLLTGTSTKVVQATDWNMQVADIKYDKSLGGALCASVMINNADRASDLLRGWAVIKIETLDKNGNVLATVYGKNVGYNANGLSWGSVSIDDNTANVKVFIVTANMNMNAFYSCLKIEPGSTATPWMPSSSEVKPTDYPSYVPGFYEGKQVSDSYVYSYVYESEYNGESGVFQIENNSVYIGSAKGSPVEITVHGPCTNPYWEILDGSKVLQSDGYNIDVPEGYRLVVSSVIQKQRVKLIAPDGTISDVYQQQDLSRSNFITIPEGHVTLAFHNVGDVSFNYREEYITV
ncbi:MAG: phage distal tail protein domain-containing protein [Pseudolactococcus laudensis]